MRTGFVSALPFTLRRVVKIDAVANCNFNYTATRHQMWTSMNRQQVSNRKKQVGELGWMRKRHGLFDLEMGKWMTT